MFDRLSKASALARGLAAVVATLDELAYANPGLLAGKHAARFRDLVEMAAATAAPLRDLVADAQEQAQIAVMPVAASPRP